MKTDLPLQKSNNFWMSNIIINENSMIFREEKYSFYMRNHISYLKLEDNKAMA